MIAARLSLKYVEHALSAGGHRKQLLVLVDVRERQSADPLLLQKPFGTTALVYPTVHADVVSAELVVGYDDRKDAPPR
jgi:hypothetical protein